jgi:hypothetical protein
VTYGANGGYGAVDDEELDDELAPGESPLDGNDLVSTPFLPPPVPLPQSVGPNMAGSAQTLIQLLQRRRMGM